MCYALLGSCIGTRRKDTEIAIDLQAVGVDDRPAECIGQLQRERRFAAGRRAGDDEDRLLLVAGRLSGVGGLMSMVLTLIAGPRAKPRLPRLVPVIAKALRIH